MVHCSACNTCHASPPVATPLAGIASVTSDKEVANIWCTASSRRKFWPGDGMPSCSKDNKEFFSTVKINTFTDTQISVRTPFILFCLNPPFFEQGLVLQHHICVNLGAYWQPVPWGHRLACSDSMHISSRVCLMSCGKFIIWSRSYC